MNASAPGLRPTLEAALVPLLRALEAPPKEALTCIEVSLPAAELELVYDALSDEDAVFWGAPGEAPALALGTARLYRAAGPERFARLREATSALPSWARLFAGFSFDPEVDADRGPGWGFGAARALLPRFLLRRFAGETRLLCTLDRETDDESTRVRLRDQLETLVLALRSAPELLTSSVQPLREDPAEAEAFLGLVRTARDAVRSGAVDKVVVHRQTELPSKGRRSPGAVLAALAATQGASTCFAFRVAGTSFLGATPERLVRRSAHRLFADVLAGSQPRDHDETGPERLFASAKERAEHELTRRAIVESLSPYCNELVEDGPRVRSLPHLYHLHTAIEGQLATATHVLELVAALHPTPAVGGSPRAAALAFIAAHEGASRGWYAAPIGWFRPGGEGDFAVALRCALFAPERTTLYAGCGIVADSDPARELAESASKRRAMLSALGLEFSRQGRESA